MSYVSAASMREAEEKASDQSILEVAERRVWDYLAPLERATKAEGETVSENQTGEKARALRANIERVARRPYSILITGETGTGKTFAARQIHRRSARSAKPFVELNCANLPENLVESELFGYRKGAFTGADRDHKGLFEEADGGVLFLDEIGDIPPAVQNKLLKAIDEKQIKRLGTNRFIDCDVQIMAATSRNLPEMIRRGEFREDLYCRLAVLTLEVPPLRERREEIPALIAFYLREAARFAASPANPSPSFRIERGAVELLCEFHYPGNIRALRNLIYELTSYVDIDEPITAEMVRVLLVKLQLMEETQVTNATDAKRNVLPIDLDEGDIILPLEVRVLRRGETFKQWTARAKKCGIEAVRQATGGTLRSAAERFGVTRSSLKGHLHRAKSAEREESE
jgi:transcriptional regulator with GAF, ATPase, and Fis domain